MSASFSHHDYRRPSASFFAAVAIAGMALAAHADSPAANPAPAPPHRLFQVSVIDAFLSGVFDGDVTIGELKRHGDFGIGSFNGGDGELIALDGQVWQVRADTGVPRLVSDDVKTPFAIVNVFTPSRVLYRSTPISRDDFEKWLDSQLPTLNSIYAIRITGKFAAVKTRAIPTTTKRPYPPLAALVPSQKTFAFKNESGTLIGYRVPPYLKAVNIPGYHYHFLTADRKGGGHVLDYTITEARIEIDDIRGLDLSLPGQRDMAFAHAPLDRDRSGETKTVEMEPSKAKRK